MNNNFIYNVTLLATNMDDWSMHIKETIFKYSKNNSNILRDQTEDFLEEIFNFKFDFVISPIY